MTIVLLLAAVGCGPSGSDGSATEVRRFCDAWAAALAGGDEPAYLRLLEDPPPGIEDEASELLELSRAPEDEESPGANESVKRFTQWIEIECHPDVAGADATGNDRRFAPPLGSPSSFRVCAATTTSPFAADTGRMVVYGDKARPDPYDGPMLGVVWGAGDAADQGGDGDRTPVTVRGTSGVAAPITVFQQVIPEGLGTVIALSEHGLSVGLYGRGWPSERRAELVALAERLQFADGGFALPDTALPAGYARVFEGSPLGMSLVLNPQSAYQLHYRSVAAEGQLVIVSGFVASPEEFAAVRFLAPGIQPARLGAREALVGNAWGPSGPGFVSWREADGLVVRIVGVGIGLDGVREVASATRELSRGEWIALIEGAEGCVSR